MAMGSSDGVAPSTAPNTGDNMRTAYISMDPVNSGGVKMWLMSFLETDKTMDLVCWKDQIKRLGFEKYFQEKHLMRHALWFGGEDLEAAVEAQALVAMMCEHSSMKSLAHFGKEVINKPFIVGLMRNGLIMPIPQKSMQMVIEILTHRQTLWCFLYHKGKGKCGEADQELRDIEDIDKAPLDTGMSLEDIITKANAGKMRDFLK